MGPLGTVDGSVSPSVSHDAVGLVVADRYRLVARLGSGPSATVYLADDVRLRRRVAVKMLHGALGADRAFVDRFGAEMQAAAALRHPHIGAVHDWGVDRMPFVVTDYFDHGSLRGLLDRGVVLDASQVMQIALAGARALAYAHERGIVHRDVRPENLLFGDDGRIQLVDFGLARARAEAASTRPLELGARARAHLAPEQVRGGVLDGRADVFAFVAVLVEAATGRPPVPRAATPGGLDEVAAPPVPATLGPMRDVLARASTVDPHERLDATGLVTALMAVAEAYPDPEPIPLGMPGPPGPAPALEPTVAVGAIADRAGTPEDLTIIRGPTPAPEEAGAVAGPVTEPATVTDRACPDEPAGSGAGAVTAPVEPTEPDPAVRPVDASGPPAEPEPPETPPAAARRRGMFRGRRLAWILLAVLLVVGGGVVGAVVYQAQRTPTHEIPDLRGSSPQAAEQRLEALGFQVHIERVRRDDTAAGDLLGVDPPSGTRLAEGERVTLTVSEGPPLVEIPGDVAGLTADDARERLDALGLVVERVDERWSEEVPSGQVVSTAPGAGDELEKGASVVLVVSQGPEPRVIPQVGGMTAAQFEATLRDMGLVPEVSERYDTEVDTGGLIGLEPMSGTTVPRGATVELVVSKGLLVAVPSLEGVDTVAGAIRALESAGLVADELLGSGSLSGRPAAFEPGAGELVPKGSAVDIIVR